MAIVRSPHIHTHLHCPGGRVIKPQSAVLGAWLTANTSFSVRLSSALEFFVPYVNCLKALAKQEGKEKHVRILVQKKLDAPFGQF